jgi:hypothetical protein
MIVRVIIIYHQFIRDKEYNVNKQSIYSVEPLTLVPLLQPKINNHESKKSHRDFEWLDLLPGRIVHIGALTYRGSSAENSGSRRLNNLAATRSYFFLYTINTKEKLLRKYGTLILILLTIWLVVTVTLNWIRTPSFHLILVI